MYPKGEISKLNRRRQANQRIAFARRRLWETVVELQFARGKITSLPKTIPVPPERALKAARLVSDRWIAPTTKLTPEVIRADPRGALKEIMGLFDAMVAFMRRIPEDAPDGALSKEERKGLDKLNAMVASTRFLAHLKRLERVLGEKLPTPTHEELVAHARRYEKGLTEMFAPEGDVVGGRTLTAQICHGVWFFWPKLAQRNPLRAQDLQKFFADETGLHFGIKLVETVYSDVGLARQKNAREKSAT